MLTFKDQSAYSATIVSGFYLSTCFDKEKDFSVNTVSLEIPIAHIKVEMIACAFPLFQCLHAGEYGL